ncbi:MAG: dicarboxylate/amino acid:cation symporter [Acidobacteriota bacterium]
MQRLLRLELHWQVLMAMLLGVAFALTFGQVSWIDGLAEIFLRLLRMIIVPLIFTSIVHGVAGIGGGSHLGRLGLKTLLYYSLSSFLAICVGLILANTLRPGAGVTDFGNTEFSPEDLEAPASLAETLIRLVPLNPVAAAANFDILGLIFFSLCLGAALSGMSGAQGDRMRSFFDGLFELVLRLTLMVIKLLPIGVFALIARAVSSLGLGVAAQVGKWILTLSLGLAIHLFVVLPLVFFLLTRKNPFAHYRAVGSAMAMAFSTSSSAATLPVSLTAVRDRAGVSDRVSSFVLPMGATVNMDGTALFECAGALFIAQALGFELSLPAQLAMVLTAFLASVGAAAVPSAGLVMIFIVLEAIGLTDPRAYALVGLMLGVDRPLDMMRTTVNVTSDTVGAAIIAHSEGEELNY